MKDAAYKANSSMDSPVMVKGDSHYLWDLMQPMLSKNPTERMKDLEL